MKNPLILILIISSAFSAFSQDEELPVRKSDSISLQLTDTTIYGKFWIGMTRKEVRKINGKSSRFSYSMRKRRLIKKSQRSVRDAIGCGTAINMSRMYKRVNRNRRLKEVWYYPSFGGVYVQFNETDSVQAVRFVGKDIGLTNGLTIGMEEYFAKPLLSALNDSNFWSHIDYRTDVVSQIVLYNGNDEALEIRGNYFFDFEF